MASNNRLVADTIRLLFPSISLEEASAIEAEVKGCMPSSGGRLNLNLHSPATQTKKSDSAGLANETNHCLRRPSSRFRPFKKHLIKPTRLTSCSSSDSAGAVKKLPEVSKRQILLGLASTASLYALGQHSAAAAASSAPEEHAVRLAVDSAFAKTAGKSKAPVLLRLVFHDAGTYSSSKGAGGANASIRFELKRPENSGLGRGWKVIEQTMQELKGTPADGRVGYADLIAMGGAYAVAVTGGPKINVSIGRPDAIVEDPWGRLPSESLAASELLRTFADKGFSAQEFVALSGAHTLGNKGFGDPVLFDNAYYKALLQKPWNDKQNSMANMIGLPSDHVLPESEDCLPTIKQYASSQEAFFEDFAAAYTKLTNLGTNFG